MTPAAFPPEFYRRPAEEVAPDLLGADLVSTIGGALTTGRIVEVEAYVGPHDPASHAAERIGRTPRNATMFGPPGVAYVYRIYGLHWCLNAVTGGEGYPAAVLVRALEPLVGLDIMRDRREARRRPGSPLPERDLARGPARLAEALGITGALDGHALDTEPLLVRPGGAIPDARIERGPRIGITRAADWPLRFWVKTSRWVSR